MDIAHIFTLQVVFLGAEESSPRYEKLLWLCRFMKISSFHAHLKTAPQATRQKTCLSLAKQY